MPTSGGNRRACSASWFLTPPAALPGAWSSGGAHLFGPDDLPLQGEISFADGMIRCTKASPDAAGLTLQYEIPGGGATNLVMVPTCLLPSRLEPYLLGIELARHRIMLFLNKLEDWQLSFDRRAHPTMVQKFEQARQRSRAALVAQRDLRARQLDGYSPRPDRRGQQSLAEGIEAGEQLTLIQAGRQLKERADGQGVQQRESPTTRG
jgi:hypothetical protein